MAASGVKSAAWHGATALLTSNTTKDSSPAASIYPPFRLKLGPGLMEGPPRPFDGLHGLFNDSLPDGLGRLLMDRKLHQVGG